MPSTCGRRTWSKSCACSTLTGSEWVLFTRGRKGAYIAGTKLELVASCLPAGRQVSVQRTPSETQRGGEQHCYGG